MKFEVQSTASLVFLSLVNMCLCLQHIAEKTLNSLGTELMHAARHQHNLDTLMERKPEAPADFLLIDYLADGEMERRVRYKGITAKETSIGNNTWVPNIRKYFFVIYLSTLLKTIFLKYVCIFTISNFLQINECNDVHKTMKIISKIASSTKDKWRSKQLSLKRVMPVLS